MGGDKLISVYCILKKARNGEKRIHTELTSQGKSIKFYRLLHKKTNLSEATLKKYVPKLIDLGICNFSADGGFYLSGTNKINARFTKKINKFVKIKTGSLSETVLGSYLVRIKSLENSQIKKIEKTQRQINIMLRGQSGFLKTKSERNSFKRMVKKGITLAKLQSYCKIVILSNQGFAYYKSEQRDMKSKGSYWKRKLSTSNLIHTRRNFDFIKECTYSEYLSLKSNTGNRKLVFKNGKVYAELVSSFKSLT
jgi:hypothetical protein